MNSHSFLHSWPEHTTIAMNTNGSSDAHVFPEVNQAQSNYTVMNGFPFFPRTMKVQGYYRDHHWWLDNRSHHRRIRMGYLVAYRK
jgi:hypothetical protein